MSSPERALLRKISRKTHLLNYDEIEELLAQPEHIVDDTDMVEPVAWMQDSIELHVLEEKNSLRGYVIPLYTAPPKREPLSLEEMCKIYGDNVVEDIFTFARAIEKAHGITGVDDDN